MERGTTGESFLYYDTGTDTSVSSTYTWAATTNHVEASGEVKKDSTGIHPKLYFKYLKSKLTRLEQKTFKGRMEKLEKLVDEFTATGQEAMTDNCIRQFVVLTKEAAVYACGFTKFLTEEHVNKFRYDLRKCSLKVTPLKNFARVLPKQVAKIAKKCIEKKLFDDYVIFHLDNKSHAETEEERIERERDPILFGKIDGSSKYYFIIDWEDELCDLRFSDIVKNLALKGKDITLEKKLKFQPESE